MAKFSSRAALPIFNPATSTLDFGAFPFFDVRELYAVVDQTANAPIYLQGVSGFGYSSLSGRVLTLQASMAGLAAGDTLAVTYDDGSDNLNNLYCLAAGVPDTVAGQRLSLTGALTNDPIQNDLLRKLYAAVIVLCRLTIADKQINDSDIDSLLNDELNKLGS